MPSQKPGCFSGILRLMLCTGNVPTHPSSPSSNHVMKPDNSTKINFIDREEEDHQSGPTLIARLMGLESLPPNTHLSLQSATPDSLSRSRSVNFVDFLSKLDLAEPRRILHRRAITSVSFREVHLPGTSPRLNENKDRSTRTKRKKENNSDKGGNVDNGISKLNKKDRKKGFPRASKKSCERENGVLGSGLPRERRCSRAREKARASGRENGKKVTEKLVRRRKNEHDGSKKTMALQSSHGPRSPNCVLEVTRFSGKRRGSVCRAVKNKDLTVKLRPEVACHVGDDIELISSLPKQIRDTKTQFRYEDLAEKLVNLTTRDIASESYWNNHATIDFEGLEELCVEFEAPILDSLLQEITGEILHM